jgi:leucine-rich repeat protein SHOC2
MMMKKIILLFIFGMLFFGVMAQDVLLDSAALSKEHIYNNLKEALKNPDKVYKLDLSHHKLDSIPPEVYQFKNLQVLNIKANRLTEVPEEIGVLTHLQRLDMSRNNIVTVDPALGKLVNLIHLNLSQNEIEMLPKDIGKLVKLEELVMWENNLNDMPDEAKGMINLKKLSLEVIAMNQETQDHISSLFPKIKVKFSPSCTCHWE